MRHQGEHRVRQTDRQTDLQTDKLDIIGTNLLTKFHEDQTINVASRVFRVNKTNLLKKFHEDKTINVASRVENAQPPGGNFSIQKLVQNMIETNILDKKNALPLSGHVFQPTGTIF
ncbi:hypothetical protein DPMN_097598 [Dreissena polymorpha]|uniref:Uncharacterized protein n=1 Tax=Dreissena polymorpha TaxID=45954 RepID=A0A9D4LAT2_DREPO|nr:hypothetical protein DPMN_097598 [Dreissena polymorpha]